MFSGSVGRMIQASPPASAPDGTLFEMPLARSLMVSL